MLKFTDKVAVVTGAASGIGRALARRCVAEGMKVVLVDVERAALASTEVELRSAGARVLSVPADVSKPDGVQRVANATIETFEEVHLLLNNAGVGLIGPRVWESTEADWNWILGVNLLGAAHCLRAFVPRMLRQDSAGHVVNVASAAGWVSPPGMGVYNASKAALIALSETLYRELAETEVKVAVACPGLVRTRMVEASRNRPADLQNEPRIEADRRVCYAAEEETIRRATEDAMSPETFVDLVFEAIRDGRFWILTHPALKQAIRVRAENAIHGGDPGVGTEQA